MKHVLSSPHFFGLFPQWKPFHPWSQHPVKPVSHILAAAILCNSVIYHASFVLMRYMSTTRFQIRWSLITCTFVPWERHFSHRFNFGTDILPGRLAEIAKGRRQSRRIVSVILCGACDDPPSSKLIWRQFGGKLKACEGWENIEEQIVVVRL